VSRVLDRRSLVSHAHQRSRYSRHLTYSIVRRKKGDGVSELVNIGVFDDTADVSLTLWGATLASVDPWQPSSTILLITNPSLRPDRIPTISMVATTYVDIDPNIPDADYVRRYAQSLTKRDHVNPPFPKGGQPGCCKKARLNIADFKQCLISKQL